jgi:hypothetical protein
MPRMIWGLILVVLVAFSNVSAVEAQSTETAGTQKVQPTQLPKKSNKQISNKQSSKTPSSSINAAESYAVEHSDELPISSSSKPAVTPASPATHSWTGFHIGAGVGAGGQ